VITQWWVIDGKLKPWPLDKRWAPLPPPAPRDLTPAERREWRDDWYAAHYFPWKQDVVDAIAADLYAAAALFDKLVPEEQRPTEDTLPVKPRRTYERRRKTQSARPRRASKAAREAFTAATLADSGMTVRRVADILGITRMTAWRAIQEGREQHAELLTKMRTLTRGGPIVVAAKEGSDA
jgi:predicted DNA-binding protein (UPF0251 family)